MKRVIIVGRHYPIEPLGILHLVGIAEQLGWDVKLILVKGFDFSELYEAVKSFKPDLVGFSIWTGYHLQAFAACDAVQRMGVPVTIGGPHATYFSADCVKHATWVIKGEGFRNFRRLLQGELEPGIVHFDDVRVAEGFPIPGRDLVYESYPYLAKSPIKSIMCSVGCPFKCSYCYAPAYNKMYGGFELNVRPVPQIIDEALRIKERWPLSLIYFQDDIFGFDLTWLAEFAREWREKVNVPWHCQIRLELTNNQRRLDLFREGGCTGITLAIESGNDFLRRFVLLRGMPDELIVEGIRRIKSRGFTLRTEQILAVPFSDTETDIETLELNVRLNPEMAWTSILTPYGGTEMGTIATKYGLYRGNNDDLTETFFDRSVLRHVYGGPAAMEDAVRQRVKGVDHNPLLKDLEARDMTDHGARIYPASSAGELIVLDPRPVTEIRYLDRIHNDRYCDQTVMLQRNFNWLAKLPDGHKLAAELVSRRSSEWTWGNLGVLTKDHLMRSGYADRLEGWETQLAHQMGYPSRDDMPSRLMENPHYFTYLPSGDRLAKKVMDEGVLTEHDQNELFRRLGDETRHWLYDHLLYQVEASEPPIATR